MAKSKPRHGHGTGKPSPVDMYVGARVRQRRVLHGMTQTVLADALGLTLQQVHRYERGTNRIGSSRLYDLSRVLDVPIEYFFDDMPADVAASPPAKKLPSYEPNPMIKRETLELVRAYYKIENVNARKRVYELTKTLGAVGA